MNAQPSHAEALPLGFVAGVWGISAVAAGLAVVLRGELIAIGVVVGLAAVMLMLHAPLVWLSVAVLSLVPLVLLQGPKIETGEIVLVLGLLTSLGAWLLWQAVVMRRQLVEHWGDALLLLFLGISALNFPLALLNDVPAEEWLRRWLPMWLLLYYFPVRMYVRTQRQLLWLLLLLLIAGVGIALITVERYRSGVAFAEYAYQLRSGYARSQAEHVLALAIVSCVIGAAFLRSLGWRLLLLVCAIVMAFAVVVTFSRTAWMSVLIGLVAAWVGLTWGQRLRALVAGAVLVTVAIGMLAVAFPRLSAVLVRLVEQRFLSVGQGRRDLALQGRLFQLEKAIEELSRYPLGGQGLGKAFPYYEAGARRHIHFSYIHNGYLATAYRYGIPMALLLIAALLAHFVHSLRQMRRSPPGSLRRMAAVTAVAGLSGIVFSLMMTENPLDIRTVMLAMAWILGLANLRTVDNA